ncbi:MAG: CYTH domain-containing protein [Patescibacteria group bacterium]|jgi:adenylate cyclase class 2
MQIEYEATFLKVNKDSVRKQLKKSGAKLIRPEFLQKRIVFNFPKGNEIKGGWVRVRDEGNKTTMSIKIVDGSKIEDQKEVCLQIDNFKNAEQFLKTLGCKQKSFQESTRELWMLDNVEITIDEWPFLEPFVEIEGESEKVVKQVSKKLGFNYKKAFFGAVGTLYSQKYKLPEDTVNNETPKIIFKMNNPFIK